MADSLIDTVMRGIAMRGWGNVSLAVLIKRRVSLIIVNYRCLLSKAVVYADRQYDKLSVRSGR